MAVFELERARFSFDWGGAVPGTLNLEVTDRDKDGDPEVSARVIIRSRKVDWQLERVELPLSILGDGASAVLGFLVGVARAQGVPIPDGVAEIVALGVDLVTGGED